MNTPEPADGRTVEDVYESLNDEQKALVEYLVGEAAALGELSPEERDDFFSEIGHDLNHEEMGEAYQQMREDLIALINDLAVVRGKVTLSSGKEADYYIDLRRVTLHHLGASLIGELMLLHLMEKGYFPDATGLDGETITPEEAIPYSAVGGLTLGADPIATAILHAASGYELPIDAFVVRKEAKAHGMQRQIEGPDIAGRNVIIVEDTTTTGGSPITAIEAARAAGANPVAVATIVDRDTGAREKIEALGVPYYPMFTLSDLTI